MKLSQLLANAGFSEPVSGEAEITDIVRDPQKVHAGTLFCSLHSGARASDEIAEAIARGAAAVLTRGDTPMTTACPTLRSSEVRRTFAFLCAALAGNPQANMMIVGITGTNGKTSTAWYLTSILRSAKIPVASIGTAGLRYDTNVIPFPPRSTGISQMTTPDPELLFPMLADLRRRGIGTVVMEVSSHALALDKVTPIRFHTAVFTNFASDHLDFHGTREAYREAKHRLAAMSDRVCYNADDATWQRTFGSHENAIAFGENRSVHAENIIKQDGASSFALVIGRERAETRIASPTRFAVQNALAASAAAIALGIDLPTVVKGIADAPPIPGRAERVPLPAPLAHAQVYIDYAHTAEALDTLLRDFDRHSGSLYVLFGCGGDRDRSKRAAMAETVKKHGTFAILTSDNPRTESRAQILADAIIGFGNSKQYIVIPDRSDAITYAVERMADGDTLLLCGKGAEEYECDAAGLRQFSERETVLLAAEKRRKVMR